MIGIIFICIVNYFSQCHYHALVQHWTNLEIQTLSNLPLVSSIEILIQCLYGYFNHSPKTFWNFPNKESSSVLKILQINDYFYDSTM